ncbi:MAG TPA: methyltransferase [Gemmatimonadaceae bacterium]|nr:methyltransferase [Gemmatimonadaceae bacterium]
MPDRFLRPIPHSGLLPSFLREAGRLEPFLPPFRFTSFFSPEDTLLCAVAAEPALREACSDRAEKGQASEPMRIAELTTGSGLVGLYLLGLDNESTLTGLDVDPRAVDISRENARLLGLESRANFDRADLWSEETIALLSGHHPHLIVCNPPYVPEPPTRSLQLEAGAGPEGTAHLLRTIELAQNLKPRAMALSWCSLSDPEGIVSRAESIGYSLTSLFIVVIADGEYSGSVHEYLRSLPRAFLNEDAATVRRVAPDGAGSFAYLLLAGDFSLRKVDDEPMSATEAVGGLCREFAAGGFAALEAPKAPFPVRTWLLDRWDELRLRAFLHGEISA